MSEDFANPRAKKVYHLLNGSGGGANWTKRSYYTNEKGETCSKEEGKCFCLLGASRKLYPRLPMKNGENAFDIEMRKHVIKVSSRINVAFFNDSRDTKWEDVADFLRTMPAPKT